MNVIFVSFSKNTFLEFSCSVSPSRTLRADVSKLLDITSCPSAMFFLLTLLMGDARRKLPRAECIWDADGGAPRDTERALH